MISLAADPRDRAERLDAAAMAWLSSTGWLDDAQVRAALAHWVPEYVQAQPMPPTVAQAA